MPTSTSGSTFGDSSAPPLPLKSMTTAPKSGILTSGYNGNNNSGGSSNTGEKSEPPKVPRQRSSTMLPGLRSGGSTGIPPPVPSVVPMPRRPFAASNAVAGGGRSQRDSPASSTGDSSSGRAPFTPKDGSDIGSVVSRDVQGGGKGWSGGVSGLGNAGGRHIKRRSVSFEEDLRPNVVDVDGKGMDSYRDEDRRRERRRSEAKAAIEV